MAQDQIPQQQRWYFGWRTCSHLDTASRLQKRTKSSKQHPSGSQKIWWLLKVAKRQRIQDSSSCFSFLLRAHCWNEDYLWDKRWVKTGQITKIGFIILLRDTASHQGSLDHFKWLRIHNRMVGFPGKRHIVSESKNIKITNHRSRKLKK